MVRRVVADEDIAGEFGGYWSAMGTETLPNGTHQPIPTAHWLRDLAPGAAAVIAVGTCATWGGIPAASGNVTNAMSVMDYLGKDYLSTLGLPPVEYSRMRRLAITLPRQSPRF